MALAPLFAYWWTAALPMPIGELVPVTMMTLPWTRLKKMNINGLDQVQDMHYLLTVHWSRQLLLEFWVYPQTFPDPRVPWKVAQRALELVPWEMKSCWILRSG